MNYLTVHTKREILSYLDKRYVMNVAQYKEMKLKIDSIFLRLYHVLGRIFSNGYDADTDMIDEVVSVQTLYMNVLRYGAFYRYRQICQQLLYCVNYTGRCGIMLEQYITIIEMVHERGMNLSEEIVMFRESPFPIPGRH
jgi:hypothetical protein